MPNNPCPFCHIDISTELFYHDRWKNIIICRDKKDLGFKYRLLGVRVGKENHKQMPTLEEREDLMVPLIAVAEAQVRNGRATGYTIDEVAKEIPDHYHYYANLT